MDTKRNREEFDNSSLFSFSIGSIYPSEKGQPQWSTDDTEQSNGKTGDWAFPNSRNKTLTFPISFSTCLAVIPTAVLSSPTTDKPKINLSAFYREPTATNFIHYSMISWETTVQWYASYIAIGQG